MTSDLEAVARTTAAWRTAGEQGDAAAAARCLAIEIEVISLLTARYRFRGPNQVQLMLSAAFEVISDIRYHTEVGEHETRALFYRARCGREEVEEAQLLRFDPAGRIVELTLFRTPAARIDSGHDPHRSRPAPPPQATGHGRPHRRGNPTTGDPHPSRRRKSRPPRQPGPSSTVVNHDAVDDQGPSAASGVGPGRTGEPRPSAPWF